MASIPFPAVNRLYRNQNPYLRRDLNHPSASRQARSRLIQSGGAEAFHWMCILCPLGHSKSIAHSCCAIAGGAVSSTNAVLVALRAETGIPPSRFFRPT